jgi:hypothetical protein
LQLRSHHRVGEEMYLVYDVLRSFSRVSTQRARSQRASDSRLK